MLASPAHPRALLRSCSSLFKRSLSAGFSLSNRATLSSTFIDSSTTTSRILPLKLAPATTRSLVVERYHYAPRRFLTAQKRRTINVKLTKLEDHFKMEWPKVTLFGDSITRRAFDADNGCWGSHLAFKLGNYFDVDARGFEGYNSKWGLELMPRLFPKSYLDKVALFVIFFGHNDSWEKRMPMHVPVNDYEANMRAIIKYLEGNGLDRSQIIMITPTWYHHEDFQKFCLASGLPGTGKELEEARKYSETVQAIGRDLNIDVVDCFALSLKQEPLEAMFCDGVHFSRLGAKLLADQLMPVVEKKIEARFGKPLADLWHVTPFDQHPEVKPFLEALLNAPKQ